MLKVSQFKLKGQDRNQEVLLQHYNKLNDTRTDYPQKTIHQIFSEVANAYPDKIAASLGVYVADYFNNPFFSGELTYRELEEESNRMCRFLLDQGVQPEDRVAVLLSSGLDIVVGILGILKAGAAYVPINTEYPYERIKFIVNDAGCELVVSEKKFIRELNKLQWECPVLKGFLCVDSDNVGAEKEVLNELMRTDLWEYVGETSDDEISGGGWKSSYTGDYLSKELMEEYAANIDRRLSSYVSPEKSVLEIGCSSGICLKMIAPHVKSYVGIDLSAQILAKTAARVKEAGLTNVELHQLPADRVDELKCGDFDIIILSSVVQCFNGHNYLKQVIAKAFSLLKEGGVIYFGDIMDLDRKEDLIKSLRLFKQKHGDAFNTKLDWSNELFLSRAFFEDLIFDFPRIRTVEFYEKMGSRESELRDFRFDAILEADHVPGPPTHARTRKQFGRSSFKERSGDAVAALAQCENLAYVIYTSGSTGTPKGVMVEHRGIVRLVKNTNYLDIGAHDVMLQAGAISFDASAFEIWAALLNGAKLVHVSKDNLLDEDLFPSFLRNSGVNVALMIPSIFNHFVSKDTKMFAGLTTLLLGGEAISPKHVGLLLDDCPAINVINAYGPTENSVIATTYKIQGNGARIPIGKPISNSQVYIMKDGNLLTPGVVGELCIGGDGLARGYLNDPLLTADKFQFSEHVGSRVYRTGDQARMLPDGNVEFLGRIDSQVKIRGFRVETAEVENEIRKLGSIEDVAVISRTDGKGDSYLCAYLVLKQSCDEETLTNVLRNALPPFMLPSSFVFMDRIPVNSSGKLDKKALPEPRSTVGLVAAFEPQDEIERVVYKIWKDVLDIQQFDGHDNFFHLGGHSLKATQVISKLSKELDTNISIRDIFSAPVFLELCQLVKLKAKKQFEEIQPAPIEEYYEVSHAQKRLWILGQMLSDRTLYNIPALYELKGDLNKTALNNAFDFLIRRHEILRTVILSHEGSPKQKVLTSEQCKFDVEWMDLTAKTSVEKSALASQAIQQTANREFDMAQGPLLNVRVVQLSETEFRLIFCIHHIIADQWSTGILMKEFSAAYHGFANALPITLPPLAVQYKDFATWQNRFLSSEKAELHKKYWLSQLDGDLPELKLPYRNAKSQETNPEEYTTTFDSKLTETLVRFCHENDCSLYMVLLAAVNVLLSKYAGQSDFVIATPVAGRDHVSLAGQVGLFLNVLPMRIKSDGSRNFISMVRHVRAVALGAYEHQAYPFDSMLEDLQRVGGENTPLYNVEVELLSETETAVNSTAHLAIRELDIDFSKAKDDLSFTFVKSASDLSLTVTLRKEAFRPAWAAGIIPHLTDLMKRLMMSPGVAVNSLPLLPTLEGKTLFESFNKPAEASSVVHVMDEFERMVARYPEAVALRGAQTFSYAQLNRKANQLAHHLVTEAKVEPEDVIGLLAESRELVIVGMLAAAKAGCAFLPIETTFPSPRIEYMMRTSHVKTLLLETTQLEKLAGYSGQVFALDVQLETLETAETNNHAIRRNASLAYIIYTSGTTGVPKGVEVKLSALWNYIQWVRSTFSIGPGDKTLLLSSTSFDLGYTGIWTSLLTGGELHVVNGDFAQQAESIVGYLAQHGITYIKTTPSLFHILTHVDSFEHHAKNMKLRLILLGGERYRFQDIVRYSDLNPATVFVNHYGPTETTIGTIYEIFDRGDRRLYETETILGRPIPNNDVSIVNSLGQPVPVGIEGELCIGGAGLARGYSGGGDASNKFVPHPIHDGRIAYRTGDLGYWLPDGRIAFLGREDRQVKIRGYRVELNEIETVIKGHDEVDDAVVEFLETMHGPELIAYVATGQENSTLIGSLRQKLPGFMVPRVVFVPGFPVTANGKVDVKRLRQWDDGSIVARPYVPPATACEEQLQQLWQEILGLKEISVDDNFFEIGGHSLKAIQVLSGLHKTLSISIELRDIFDFPTIRQLGQRLTQIGAPLQYIPLGKAPLDSWYPLSHAQYRLWILHQTGAGNASNQPRAYWLKGDVDIAAFRKSILALVARHESLRTRFQTIDGEPRQQVVDSIGDRVVVDFVDLSSAPDHRTAVLNLVEEAAFTPFDLRAGFLFRCKIISVNSGKHILIFTTHHIISDGWSIEVLMRDLKTIYDAMKAGATNPLTPLDLQYKDYAVWQQGSMADGSLNDSCGYWKSRLSGQLQQLDFANGKRSENRQGKVESRELGGTLSAALKALSASHGVTLFMAVVAGAKALLYRYTGCEDILVGTPVAGRDHADLEKMVGCFVNNLPLRTTLAGDDSFEALLKKVSDTCLEAYQHQAYPFDKMIEDVGVKQFKNRFPLFDIAILLENETVLERIEEEKLFGDRIESNFLPMSLDMRIVFTNYAGNLTLNIEYRDDLFSKEFVDTFCEKYVRILSVMTREVTSQIDAADIELETFHKPSQKTVNSLLNF